MTAGLAPPLTPEEYAFNAGGETYKGKGKVRTISHRGTWWKELNRLISVLMLKPGRAMRHAGHFRHRDGSLMNCIVAVTAISSSDGEPEYLLSMVQMSTVRVISHNHDNDNACADTETNAEWHPYTSCITSYLACHVMSCHHMCIHTTLRYVPYHPIPSHLTAYVQLIINITSSPVLQA
jgi:hypothetical protein